MTPYQRGFYTAETLKLQEKTHGAIFNRIHVEQKMLPDAEAWASFFAGYGVTKEQALSTYNSAAVTEQMKRASEAFKSYQISGTPELVVDGKYRISSRFTPAHEDMLKVIQFLVNKARAEHRAKK
jgi:thiol:disulfide interchange protein DsbA